MVLTEYNREHALMYAERWAFKRNPIFYNFAGIGGDCTSYISQCVYAGSCQMNYDEPDAWYYINIDNRSPSWSGVNFFYNFLVSNEGLGPFGEDTYAGGLQIGDIVQLQNEQGRFYHTLLVTGFDEGTYLVSAHTDDAFNRRLDTYQYAGIRFIHIIGVRRPERNKTECFYDFYNGISL